MHAEDVSHKRLVRVAERAADGAREGQRAEHSMREAPVAVRRRGAGKDVPKTKYICFEIL